MNYGAAEDAPPGLARSALAALLVAIPMCWPLFVTGQVFVFFDTSGYLSIGDQIIGMLRDRLDALLDSSPNAQPGTGADPAAGSETDGRSLRSFGYSFFAAIAVMLGGPVLLALAQGWIAVFVTLALVPRASVTPWGLLLVPPLALTTLPWFTVFVMPDIFAAVIVAYGAVLWRAFDSLSLSHRVLLGALAAGASLVHYGNPPLALGLYTLVLCARLLQKRLSLAVLLAAAVPVLTGPVANLGASAVVLDKPSAAPMRLPILLARSIEDGPAAWYLAEACAEGQDLAICAAFDGDVPDDISVFLWSDQGIRSLTEDERAAVRDEEARVLWAAFLAYPVAQTQSLTRNAWTQFHSVGLAKIRPVSSLENIDMSSALPESLRLLDMFDRIVDWTTLAGALLLIPLVLKNRARAMPVAIILAGLALNAIEFGGLSAPDDRYQARVAWLLPALALSYLMSDLYRGAKKRQGTRQTGTHVLGKR